MSSDEIQRLTDLLRTHIEQEHEITVEPAMGETYDGGEMTVYAYGVYKEGSVLAGQQMRCYVAQLPASITPEFFVESCKHLLNVDVKVYEHTLWHENFNTYNHLSDGPD